MSRELAIGLALSGGGARAMAFHLGCLRVLHDKGILSKITVLSTVSGGSVIGAMWAYSETSFEEFDAEVQKHLSNGFTKGIAKYSLLSGETFKIVGTILSSGVANLASSMLFLITKPLGLLGIRVPLISEFRKFVASKFRRWASRSTAFEKYLRQHVYGNLCLDDVKRPGLGVVINATELRTGTAFRFGSKETGSWRFGTLKGHIPYISQAVAASAAFPAALPALDQIHEFELRGTVEKKRVLLADGGVYDNLGLSCLIPNRSVAFSTNVYDVDFIISCDAGHGLPSGEDLVYNWGGRLNATVNTIFRRANNQGHGQLHDLAEQGSIEGFLLPYLGQQDRSLPYQPPDLVSRSDVVSYPTDFAPMTPGDINLLSKRGEQLTSLLIEHYRPDL